MNKTLTTWLLGGALAASLSWNVQHARGSTDPAPACGEDMICGGLDPTELGLDQTQMGKLEELCGRSCGAADRLERRANELQRELLGSLAEPAIDEPAARALVAEIAELRRQSLEKCVAGILEVRSLLTPDQLATLLARCELRGSTCSPETSCK